MNPHKEPTTIDDAIVNRNLTRMNWSFWLSLYALATAGAVARVRPGGPFISISGNILPVFAAVVSFYWAYLILRDLGLAERLFAWIFIAMSIYAIVAVAIDVYSFWVRPYARGDLIGL